MGHLVQQLQGVTASGAACRFCGHDNTAGDVCRHVRWSVDRGDPLAFARFALETSPYLPGRGHRLSDIPRAWWDEHADWIVDQVLTRFDIAGGFVFGELVDLDMLARDVWKEFQPDPVRRPPLRY